MINFVHIISGMNRLAILWTLPYWKDLLVVHLIDPMHVVNNVAHWLYWYTTNKFLDTIALI